KIRMERRLHALDRRQAGNLDRDRIRDEEVPVRVLVDHLSVLRVQRLRGHIDVVQAEAEGEDELPQGRGADPAALKGLKGLRPVIVDSRQQARRAIPTVSGISQLEIL